MRKFFLTSLLIGLLLCPALARPEVADKANEKTGPIGEKTPPARWGACVFDEHNKEWLWFGGAGGVSERGALGTWTFKDGKWSRPDLTPLPGLAVELEISKGPCDLYAAVANRYYRSDTERAAAVDLAKECRELANRVGAHFKDTPAGAVPELDALKAKLSALTGRLGGELSTKEVADARDAWMAAVRLDWKLLPEPAARSYPSMVYDAKTKSIVLFGGEGVHGQYNDTWIYDCTKKAWRNAMPKLAPPPRMSAGMVARDGVVYLVGGIEIRDTTSYQGACWQLMPTDLWNYDIAANTWTRLAAGEGKTIPTIWTFPVRATLGDDGRTITWTWDIFSYGKKKDEANGTFDLAKLAGADADTAKAGQSSDAIRSHGLVFDPAWYEDVPPADPDAVAKRLASLPANQWVDMEPPKEHFNRDWGTSVLDPRGDQLLQWAGGHCAYCGTGVAHYSIATNRWHILYQPELPFQFCYSNSGPDVPSLSGRPWAEHSYLSVGVDAVTGQMMWTWAKGAYSVVNPSGVWLYDPARYEWAAPGFEVKGGWFHMERHKTCLAPTPRGLAVWACKTTGTNGPSGLWMADVAERVFNPVAATDRKVEHTYAWSQFGDVHGMTWDSKRNRTLMFHFGHNEKYKIWATDLATGKVTVLEPANSENFPADVSVGREATYIPDADVVIVPTRGKPAQRTLVYDCAANAWLELTGAESTVKRGERMVQAPTYGVGSGVEWDAKRKLLWHVGWRGGIHVMRFDRNSDRLQPLAPPPPGKE